MAKSRRVSAGQGQVPGTASKTTGKAVKKPPLEASVVKSILKWLNDQPGCHAVKTRGDNRQAGWPDIIGSWQGRFFAFEVKRPGSNRVTALQQATLNKWQGARGIVGVVHSVDEVKKLLGVM